jgi:CP family cyanate transporter-like MFS transporter
LPSGCRDGARTAPRRQEPEAGREADRRSSVRAPVVKAVFPGVIKREFPRDVAIVTGLYSATMMGGGAIGAQVSPLVAGASGSWHIRRPWLWLALSMQAAGFAGLVLRPEAALLWALLTGAGLGGCFALTMVVALDHLPDPARAGALSALMQGGGFLIAAVPPWIVAVLHDATGGFTGGWLLHLGSVVLVACLALRLAPRGYARAMRVSDV